jgi:hypothetical protein
VHKMHINFFISNPVGMLMPTATDLQHGPSQKVLLRSGEDTPAALGRLVHARRPCRRLRPLVMQR